MNIKELLKAGLKAASKWANLNMIEILKRQVDRENIFTNTAPRALIPQLTSLIFYSCKSKLDCWSLFCSLLSSNRERGRAWCCPMTGRHFSVVS